MEFERIICASGPSGGHLERPSDQKVPHKIAFIQCAGSRDMNHMPYCTGVCCMHSTKEAILANEHHPEIESFIFYMDNRAVGKGFQDYILRAEREYKVNFIRGRPGLITEGPEGNPIIHYDDTREGRFKSMEVELVILAQALVPSTGTRQLSDIFGFKIDEYGFIESPDKILRSVDTTVPGVFACGFCQEPMDIPEGVAQASGAAARVAESLEVEKK
jgi:heterodisulfide reductase subunit A